MLPPSAQLHVPGSLIILTMDATGCTTKSGISCVADASVYSGISGATDASVYTTATNATGLTGPTRARPEKYPAVEVLYNEKAARTDASSLGTQVTKNIGAFSLPLLSKGQRRRKNRQKKRSSLVYTRDTDEVALFTSIPEGMAQI